MNAPGDQLDELRRELDACLDVEDGRELREGLRYIYVECIGIDAGGGQA